MKILPVTHTTNYLNNDTQKHYLNRNNGIDTFERTTNLSFKNKPIQAAKPTLEKIKKVIECAGGAFLANYFLNIKSDPNGKKLMENPEEAKKR